jgi:hypothetical protein
MEVVVVWIRLLIKKFKEWGNQSSGCCLDVVIQAGDQSTALNEA